MSAAPGPDGLRPARQRLVLAFGQVQQAKADMPFMAWLLSKRSAGSTSCYGDHLWNDQGYGPAGH